MAHQSDIMPTERNGKIGYWLGSGEVVTTRRIADELDCSMHSAAKILNRLSRVLPITAVEGVRDYRDGTGRLLWYSIETCDDPPEWEEEG